MLRILPFIRVNRPIHFAVTQLKSLLNALRRDSCFSKIVGMKDRVLPDASAFDSPARKAFPPRFKLFSRYGCDLRPSLGQVGSHVAPPNVAVPEVAKIFPRESVQAPSGRKTHKIVNAFFAC